jgi:alkanesulfonate monooxygenase SsuD/methylene tetrahydromethanopterin reductase-like flavin-dependent oxidoreductase (luciferase family)
MTSWRYNMKVSVGLPATIPNASGTLILEWARMADEAGFHSLGVIDRTVYSNHEALISLGAAAAITKKIRLMSTVLILPSREASVVAKQLATIDSISGGRVTAAFGVGGRKEDYEINEQGFKNRGKHMENQIALMREIWSGKKVAGNYGYVGPSPKQKDGIEILLGGYSNPSFERAGRIADGFITGGVADPQAAAGMFAAGQASWKANNRKGKPRLVCCVYYGLGNKSVDRAGEYLRNYYGELGEMILKGLQSSPQQIKENLRSFESIGADEVMFWPTIPEIYQLEQLMSVVIT